MLLAGSMWYDAECRTLHEAANLDNAPPNKSSPQADALLLSTVKAIGIIRPAGRVASRAGLSIWASCPAAREMWLDRRNIRLEANTLPTVWHSRQLEDG